MSSLSANGMAAASASAVPASVKSQHVRPAPSRAWISPTKMPCMSERAASLASLRDGVSRLVERRLWSPFRFNVERGSPMRSAMVSLWNRSSRARSSTGKKRLMRVPPP